MKADEIHTDYRAWEYMNNVYIIPVVGVDLMFIILRAIPSFILLIDYCIISYAKKKKQGPNGIMRLFLS